MAIAVVGKWRRSRTAPALPEAPLLERMEPWDDRAVLTGGAGAGGGLVLAQQDAYDSQAGGDESIAGRADAE